VSGTVLTIHARNYVGNLLFANYYTVLCCDCYKFYFVFFNMPQHPPTGIEYLSLSGRSVCVPNSDPPVKISNIQPWNMIRLNYFILDDYRVVCRVNVYKIKWHDQKKESTDQSI